MVHQVMLDEVDDTLVLDHGTADADRTERLVQTFERAGLPRLHVARIHGRLVCVDDGPVYAAVRRLVGCGPVAIRVVSTDRPVETMKFLEEANDSRPEDSVVDPEDLRERLDSLTRAVEHLLRDQGDMCPPALREALWYAAQAIGMPHCPCSGLDPQCPFCLTVGRVLPVAAFREDVGDPIE